MALMIKVTRETERTERGPFGPRTITEKTTERVPLTVPRSFSMYTAAGNARLRKLAESAMAEVEAVQRDETSVKRVLVKFLTKWDLLSDTKSFGEAADTAVRGAVGNFHDRLAVASGHWDEFDTYDLWERHRDAAYGKATTVRQRRKAAKAAKAEPPK